MKINRIYKGLVSRLNRLGIIPRKLTNTAYYALSNKDNFIVINAPLFQFMNKIKSFNIGDDLNFYLVSQLTGKKVIAYWAFYHSKQQSSIMAIGSVIDQFGNRQSTVWGSGILLPPPPIVVGINNIKTRWAMSSLFVERRPAVFC